MTAEQKTNKISVEKQRRNMEYSVDAAVLDGWNVTRLLGEGGYGKVFEIERSEFGQTYRAALKVITVPQSARRFGA